MSYKQVSEVLESVNELHLQLMEAIESKATESQDQRLKLLVAFLRHQQVSVAAALRQDDEVTATNVRSAWIQYIPDEEVESAIARLKSSTEEPIDEVISRMHEASEAFVEMYDSLAHQSSAQHVYEFFTSLRDAAKSFAQQKTWGLRSASY